MAMAVMNVTSNIGYGGKVSFLHGFRNWKSAVYAKTPDITWKNIQLEASTLFIFMIVC